MIHQLVPDPPKHNDFGQTNRLLHVCQALIRKCVFSLFSWCISKHEVVLISCSSSHTMNCHGYWPMGWCGWSSWEIDYGLSIDLPFTSEAHRSRIQTPMVRKPATSNSLCLASSVCLYISRNNFKTLNLPFVLNPSMSTLYQVSISNMLCFEDSKLMAKSYIYVRDLYLESYLSPIWKSYKDTNITWTTKSL
jgi:hypothetical protein